MRALYSRFIMTIVLAGCGNEVKERRDQPPVAPPGGAPAAKPTDTITASPVQWSLGNLETTLRKAGLNPVRRGVVRQPFLGDEGMAYQVGSAELQVYLYADAGAVARDTEPLDTTRVAPPTMQITWRMPPALIVDNNMVVILLTRDEVLRRRIKAAIKEGDRD